MDDTIERKVRREMTELQRNGSLLEGTVLFEPFDDDQEVEMIHNNDSNNDWKVGAAINSSSSNNNNNNNNVKFDESLHNNNNGGPVDLDEMLQMYAAAENQHLFSDDDDFFRTHNVVLGDTDILDKHDKKYRRNNNNNDDDDDDDDVDVDVDNENHWEETAPRYFNNPNQRLFDTDASLIPGSPFSKPAIRPSNRPREALRVAKYTSTFAFLGTVATITFLTFNAIYTYEKNVGRIIIEILLGLFSFFGIFWNIYCTISSIIKCFLPVQAFKTNTKYCSIIPETKDARDEWMDITIQIPVYRESLVHVLMPTLRSCVSARRAYQQQTNHTATCNIVVCDDGMMIMLRDNFPAAEMIWEQIVATKGRVLKLSQLLVTVPRASRSHLRGLQSRDVYDVFYRMLYYYHNDIGFVARSSFDRRGKIKKASNLNTHLRLAWGAQQRASEQDISLDDAMLEEAHNTDGSRLVMFGNDIRIGHLIVVNHANARMAECVIPKTVPEFLNDKSLGFTQHSTKALDEQRGESYFTNLLAVYTDMLYQGHFLLSSILGCHPPLVGNSVFLRSDAIKQCGRVRTLRKAQQWLKSIGLNFLPVDQVGFANLQAQNRIEYWSESNVLADLELMIHLYSLGFNGRYVHYTDCEFQLGIARTFDEEASRYRKIAHGAHELVFHPFQDMFGRGIFTPVFRTLLTCEIPSYYKVYLIAYLSSYASGGSYILVFSVSAILQMVDQQTDIEVLSMFNPATVIISIFAIYYVVGFFTFVIALLRVNMINNKLFFNHYRKKWFSGCYLIFTLTRYCFAFQFLFFNVVAFTTYLLGSIDHMLARPITITSANKDWTNTTSRTRALCDTISDNIFNWIVAFMLLILSYGTVLQSFNWDTTIIPESKHVYLQNILFAGPAVFLAVLAILVPIILNPYIFGWPFIRRRKIYTPNKTLKTETMKHTPTERSTSLVSQKPSDDNINNNDAVSSTADKLTKRIGSLKTNDIDLETGSRTTNDIRVAIAQSPGKQNQNQQHLDQSIVPSKVNESAGSPTTAQASFRAAGRGSYSLHELAKNEAPESAIVNPLPYLLESSARRTVPLKGPTYEALYKSPPQQRALCEGGHPKMRPTSRTPPQSPVRRRNTASISPGRRRHSSSLKAVRSDEWGFPIK